MKIKGSAIKLGEFVHWGTTIHACLIVELFDLGKMPQRYETMMEKQDWETVYLVIGYEEGFVLEDGTFVDRFEAAQIAVAEQQIDCIGDCYRSNELHLPDVYHTLA